MYYSQPGIFNALDDWGSLGQGMVSGDSSMAQHNALALQATIEAAVASCSPDYKYGAIVLIPSNGDVPTPVNSTGTVGTGGEYFIAAPSETATAAVTITCPYPLLILGTGDGTTLHMTTDSIHMFEVNNGHSSDNIGGVSFQDLQFEYDGTLTAGAAIYIGTNESGADSAQNVRVFRCTFTDVPQGVYITNALQFSMLDCTGVFVSRSSGTMVTIGDQGGDNTGSFFAYIADCSFSVDASELGATVGLSVGKADELHCVDTYFSGFQSGIAITPDLTTRDLSFVNVTAQGPGTQLLIQPVSGKNVQNAAVINCNFTNTLEASTLSAVVVDAGTSNPNVDSLRFVSCVCQLNPSAGLEIRSGQNIEILGGSYSSNGQAEGATSAGIWLNNYHASLSPSNVRIVGASCAASVYGEAAQKYAVIIGGGCSNIFINNCDLTGYGTPSIPILFGSAISNVQVVKCPGYNDQGTTVATAGPPTGAAFNGTYFGYYGPVVFYVINSPSHVITEIEIQGVSTHLLSGTFTLAPGSHTNATITYTPPTTPGPLFLMVGQ